MNIIPEEPEQYIEKPRPTPGLNNLLSSKQFKYYMKANTSQLFGCLRSNYEKRILHNIQPKSKGLRNSIRVAPGFNQKSLIYIGIGFGVLAITKIVKTLSNNA